MKSFHKLSKKYLLLLILGLSILLFQVKPEVKLKKELDICVSSDINSMNSSYKLNWANIWGGSETEYGYGDIIIDDNGFIYITGHTYSFGAGGYDVFIIKYNKYGDIIWTRFWGTSTHEMANDITLDSSGNIYITGRQGSSGYDLLILKYDSNGNFQWYSTWGPETFNEGSAVSVGKSGNIYIAGRAGGNFAFLKYNSAGNLIWSKTNASLLNADDMVIDESEFIYICGRDGSSSQKYLSKFNSNGVLIWNQFWGDNKIQSICDMSIDDLSNFYLTGNMNVNGTGNIDAYIIKLNSSGIVLWNVTWGSSLYELGKGITLDNIGNIYLTGEADIPNKRIDTFAAKFNSSGFQLWNNTWGGNQYDYSCGIVLDKAGSVYITGMTNSYGVGNFTGNYDIFVLKYSLTSPTNPFNLSNLIIISVLTGLSFISTIVVFYLYLKKKKSHHGS